MDWAGEFVASSAANAIPTRNLLGRLITCSPLGSSPLQRKECKGFYRIPVQSASRVSSFAVAKEKIRNEAQSVENIQGKAPDLGPRMNANGKQAHPLNE